MHEQTATILAPATDAAVERIARAAIDAVVGNAMAEPVPQPALNASFGNLPPREPRYIPTPRPSLGADVHYVLPASSPHAGQHRAAKIADCWADVDYASLTVFKAYPEDFWGRQRHNPNHSEPLSPLGADPNHPCATIGAVPYDEHKAPGTWHWPETEPEAGGR